MDRSTPRLTSFPALHSSADSLEDALARFDVGIEELGRSRPDDFDPLSSIGDAQFFLAFTGHNHSRRSAAVSSWYRAACRAHGLLRESVAPRRPGPPRIAVVSRHLFGHTISWLFTGLLEGLALRGFEVEVFAIPSPSRRLLRAALAFPSDPELLRRVDAPRALLVRDLPPNPLAGRDMVAESTPDVLLFPDVGMEPYSYYLAHSRLAPLQAVTWGHPMSTGISTLDCFLSSVDMEPEGAEDWYTEELVRFPAMLSVVAPPRPPPDWTPLTRSDLGLPEGALLLGCPQSLFKIHPRMDALVAASLEQNESLRIVLLEGKRPGWTDLLRARLAKLLPTSASARVLFSPRLPHAEFLSLLHNLDLALDSYPFGGGRTTYELLASGIPVATLEGRSARGRISSSLYRQMGFLDPVASTDEELLSLVLRLTGEPRELAPLRDEITLRREALFDQQAGCDLLARFLTERLDASPRPS